jgi:mRNA interferase MazF
VAEKPGALLPAPNSPEGYPFEVPVGGRHGSAALSDQVKILGWRSREAKRKGRVPADLLAEVRARIHPLAG